MTWHVWCDGSCQHGVPTAAPGARGWGGWAAIVEHGHDGLVLRGRVPETTNVRMELVAATEGLRAVRDGDQAVLHTDCTTILVARNWWTDGRLPYYRGADAAYWRSLARELERCRVTLDLLTKGRYGPIHRRAHVIAGAEARGGLRDLPPNAVPLDELGGDHRVRKGMRRKIAADAFADGLLAGRVDARRARA